MSTGDRAQPVLFVSVSKSFRPAFTLAELETWVASAWAISIEKANTVDRVVAVQGKAAVAAWRVRGAYLTEETYDTGRGGERRRVGLALGEPLPILPAYNSEIPMLRRGAAVAELHVDRLRNERPRPFITLEVPASIVQGRRNKWPEIDLMELDEFSRVRLLRADFMPVDRDVLQALLEILVAERNCEEIAVEDHSGEMQELMRPYENRGTIFTFEYSRPIEH